MEDPKSSLRAALGSREEDEAEGWEATSEGGRGMADLSFFFQNAMMEGWVRVRNDEGNWDVGRGVSEWVREKGDGVMMVGRRWDKQH